LTEFRPYKQKYVKNDRCQDYMKSFLIEFSFYIMLKGFKYEDFYKKNLPLRSRFDVERLIFNESDGDNVSDFSSS